MVAADARAAPPSLASCYSPFSSCAESLHDLAHCAIGAPEGAASIGTGELFGRHRLKLGLQPARLSLVECLVGLDDVGQGLDLAEDFHRIDNTAPHQFDQMRYVCAVVAIA